MNQQAKLQYHLARLKRKLYDNGIRKKSLDIRALRIEVIEDKFGAVTFPKLIKTRLHKDKIDLSSKVLQSYCYNSIDDLIERFYSN